MINFNSPGQKIYSLMSNIGSATKKYWYEDLKGLSLNSAGCLDIIKVIDFLL